MAVRVPASTMSSESGSGMAYVDVGNFYPFELVSTGLRARHAQDAGRRCANQPASLVCRDNCHPTSCYRGKSEGALGIANVRTHERENLRGARRKVTTARYAAEDLAADAALKVRRHPLSAVSIAMVTGAVVGSLVG